MVQVIIPYLSRQKKKMSLIKTWILQQERENEMAVAYFLLRDNDWTVGKDINEYAKDLELSTHLTCTDYIYYDDAEHDTHYIAY